MKIKPSFYPVIIAFLLISNNCISQNILPQGFKQGTVEVNGNARDWTSAGVTIEKEDFVIFEVSGKVVLGAFAGSSLGDGIFGFKSFNRYPEPSHGALVCRNDDEVVSAQSRLTLTNLNTADFLGWWSINESGDHFIGYYFVSKRSQDLQFVVNDADYGNNAGSFTVKYTIIPKSLHVGRNNFNKCPRNMPTCDPLNNNCTDTRNKAWETSKKEKFYHGGGLSATYSNKTFRGVSPDIKGCQCTYNSNGILVNDNIYMGTYDYAFGLPGLISQVKYHFLWDVFPHDAYINYFIKQNRNFVYLPTSIIY